MFKRMPPIAAIAVVVGLALSACSSSGSGSSGSSSVSTSTQAPSATASAGGSQTSTNSASATASGSSGSQPAVTNSASGSTPAPAAPVGSLKVQTYPANQATWPVYIAQQKGFFTQNGVTVTATDVNSGAVAASALASNSVDLATIDSTIASPLLDGGQKLKVVTGVNIMSWHLITTQADTPKDTSFRAGVQSLKGKKIAVTSIGSGSYFALLAILQGAGLTKDDVTIVPTGSLPAFDTAFRTGQVAAGLADHGTYVRLNLTGTKPFNLVDMTRSEPDFPPLLAGVAGVPSTSYWGKAAWVDANPKIVAAFQKSIAQADVWMQDKGNHAELLRLLTAYGTPKGLDPDKYVTAVLPIIAGYMPAAGLDAQEAFNLKYGIAKKTYPAADLIATGTPGSKEAMIALAKG